MTLRGRSFALAVAVVMAVGALPAQSVATPIGAVAAAPSMTAAAPSVPGAFVSVAPQRLLDTRSGVGAAGPVVKSGTVHLQVTGRGGVPATGVSAVVMNVTVTAPSGSGYITAYPDGTPLPTASNLNFVKGQTVPNLVTVKVGTNGKVALRNGSGGTVQLIADVAGYYLDGAPSVPGAFVSVAPQRLLDTRSGVGAAGPVVKSGTVHLQVTGRGGVPATGVSAVVMNVTVTAPSGSGYITAYPDGTPLPTASNLNFVKGQTVPNLVTVKVGTNGKVALRNGSGGTVQLIADVAGYYLDGAPSVPGAFVSVAPQRLLDTRSGVGAAGPVVKSGTVHLQVTGRGGVPATGVSAVVMNVTVTAPSGSGYITAYPDGTPLPTASNLNFVKGQTVPNLVTVKVGTNGKVALRNGSGGTVQLIADVAGYYLDPVAVDTTPPSPVTTVTLTGTTSSTVALSWTNPADADLQGVMVRRATGATAPTSPTAGTLVADVPKGTTTLTDTALSPGTQYSYAFFAHDAVPNYATAATKTATTTAVADTTPPGPVTTVTLTGTTSSSVSLSWTNPADADLQGVMVRRATGATAPTSPTAGTLVADVPKGTTTLTDTALSPGTQYSYAFFAHDAVPNYATAATKTATTTAVADTTPPGPVTTVTLTGTTSSSVSLSWTNPADADLQGVMVRRATGATAPTSPTAGTLVADVPKGTTTLTDTALSPGTQYSYAFFAHDAVPNYATAATKTISTSTACTGPEVVHVSGVIATNTTWAPGACGTTFLLSDVLVVPAGVTLTIAPGVVVKAAGGWACDYNISCALSVQGTLNAVGTAAAPITFTSMQDNSVGGSTGSGAPQPGDWYGIWTSGAGAIDLEHAVLRYASTALWATGTGPTVVRDSSFAYQSNQAALLWSPTPVLQNNTSLNAAVAAFSVKGDALDAGKISGNSASGGLRPVIQLSGTVTTNSTLQAQPAPYEIGAGDQPAGGGNSFVLVVPAGVTLTIAPGVVVKAAGGWACDYNISCALSVQGTLNAVGTAAAPITFTSMQDNSVGGSTGSGAPQPGDWYGIWTSGAGAIDLEHAVLRYASTALWATGTGPTVVRDSSFAYQSNQAALLWSPTPVLQNNTSLNAAVAAFSVKGDALDAGKISGNSASGGLRPVIQLSGTVTTNSTLQAQPAPYEIGAGDQPAGGGNSFVLVVPAGVTLTIAPGVVVKAAGGWACDYNISCALSVQGTLNAVGTAAAPITFTSMQDNSVGGSTGSGAPQPGDWYGIWTSGAGAIDLEHAVLRYASTALWATGTGPTVVRDSSFAYQSNQAALLWSPTPVLQNNTSLNAAVAAFSVKGDALDAGKISGNSASGGLRPVIQLSGTVTTNSTLQAQPAPYEIGAGDQPAGGGNSFVLVVPAGVTLTIAPGVVVKAAGGWACDYNISCALSVQGTLNAVGTAAAPITFTSMQDNSVGGSTGSGAPQPGDWYGIYVGGGGTALLDGVVLKYAAIGLYVATDSGAEIHGKVLSSTLGVQSDAYVDATNVDWGATSGPAPIGTGTAVAGQGVAVLPWVGWTAPPIPAPVAPGAEPDPPAGCKPFMFLGVRGSGEEPRDSSGDAAYTNWQTGFGAPVGETYARFRPALADKLQITDEATVQKGIALRYTAMHVPILENATGPLSVFNSFNAAYADASYNASIWMGVDRIKQYLEDEYFKCGTTQKYVMVGYSQGALAIHIYLNLRAPSFIINQIAAVGLIADPAKNGNGAESVFSNGFQTADSGMWNATGVYRKALLPGSGAIPSAIAPRTASLCHNNDIVCAPGWGSYAWNHTNYQDQADEMQGLADWLVATATAAH